MNAKLNNLCRICLGSDAKIPLFENSEFEGYDILTRFTLCLNEKIEDREGYPRCICHDCHDTIESICCFICKYRDTCKILDDRLLLMKEKIYFGDQGLLEDPEEVNKILEELESDDNNLVNASGNQDVNLTLVQSQLHTGITIENSVIQDSQNKVTVTAKSDTNQVASSILEGDFAWTGDLQCIKSTNPEDEKEEKTRNIRPQGKKEIRFAKQTEPNDPKSSSIRLCDLCGGVFENQVKLKMHQKKVHCKERIKCPNCPQVLVSRYHLKIHIHRKHDTQAQNFICSECGQTFALKSNMVTHIRNVHDKDLKPNMYTCKICNKTYKCAKSVLVHERSAHTGQRPAVCKICGTSFYHANYLKEHMRLHTGDTPFKCPICGNGYAQMSNMKSHLRIHRISDLDGDTLKNLNPSYLKFLKI